MKTFLALAIPAAGILAVLGALSSGPGMVFVMLAAAAAALWRFVLR